MLIFILARRACSLIFNLPEQTVSVSACRVLWSILLCVCNYARTYPLRLSDPSKLVPLILPFEL